MLTASKKVRQRKNRTGTARLSTSRLLRRGDHSDAGLGELGVRDLPRGAGHQVRAAGGLGEGDDVADRIRSQEEHGQTVESERDPAVGRRAEGERVQEEAELLPRVLRR